MSSESGHEDRLKAIPELPASEPPQTDFDIGRLSVPEVLSLDALRQKAHAVLADDTRAIERRERLQRTRTKASEVEWDEREEQARRSRAARIEHTPAL